MLQKKICLLGNRSVKNRIAQDNFYTMFSEKYQSTIGASFHRKCVEVDGTSVNLLLWNVGNGDEFDGIRPSYLRGMSGYALVIDESIDGAAADAVRMHELARKTVGDVPFVTLFLADSPGSSTPIDQAARQLVDDCFQQLAREIIHSE